jgi:hypothetical protein
MLECVKSWARPYHAGNMWSAWPCYLSAYRDILGLRLKEHEKFEAWERCTIEGGFRWMHTDFCIVSDFPEFIKTDDQHRPHCADGPSHRWRDGWSLYYWHGVAMPKDIFLDRALLTVDRIDAESNAEVKRAMLEMYGWAEYLWKSGAHCIDDTTDQKGNPLRLWQKDIEGEPEPLVMVELTNTTPEADGSRKRYTIRVPEGIKSAKQAQAWVCGYNNANYIEFVAQS